MLLSKNNLLRRRQRMEASGGISQGGGGEHQVRRLHIIYFLSHMGNFEQPHLLRVHHLHKNGVRLRDVKRWLANLRGKDMPEAFAWSYKRKYKNGYVWQNLMDDDLIIPICDKEYVLKGSHIYITSLVDACSFVAITKDCSGLRADRKVQAVGENHKEEEEEERDDDTTPRGSYRYCPKISNSRKSFSEIYDESPVFSSDGLTITEDSNQQEEQGPIGKKENSSRQQGSKLENFSNSSHFYTILLGDKEIKKEKISSNHKDRDMKSVDKVDTSNSSCSSRSGLADNKSNPGRASKIFRNLMNCGAIETNDDVLKPINNMFKPRSGNKDCNLDHNKGGGLTIDYWNQRHQQPRRSFEVFMGPRKEHQASGHGNTTGRVPAAYKPVGAPTCLQCGKSFRPEKLHTYMKSCRGMKAFTKAAASENKKMQFHDSQADPLHQNHQIVAIS